LISGASSKQAMGKERRLWAQTDNSKVDKNSSGDEIANVNYFISTLKL